jgi:hypothetical protein
VGVIMNKENLPPTRNKIFISHANPKDNDFTKWLSLKLIALGYIVWCDILFLDKGVDFWKTIENEIRTHTCRFLVVLSETSNESEGVLKEIAVANNVKKELGDKAFVLPLLIDEKLSYDKINIELNRLNAIDFTKSWISGLRDLSQSFIDNNIFKNAKNDDKSNEIYKKIFLLGRNTILKDEAYNSNWFTILSLPPYLYFHSIGPDDYEIFDKPFPFPTFKYKDYLCSFSEDIGYKFPSVELFNKETIIRIPTSNITDGKTVSDFASNRELKKFMIRLLNDGFRMMMENRQLKPYYLSNKKIGYWFEKSKLEKDKINGVQLVGKIKENNWHFGISGLIKLVPFRMLILSSHIFFTSDGKELIPSKIRQQKLRRKQGKSWWNKIWNEKLINFVKYLSSEDGAIRIPVGTKENIIVSSTSINFLGHYSYNEPKKNADDDDKPEFDNIDINGEEEEDDDDEGELE